MIFAEFYHLGAISKEPIPALGDRAVIILDGRHSLATNCEISKEVCQARGFIGYRVHKGETFTRSHPVTSLIMI